MVTGTVQTLRHFCDFQWYIFCTVTAADFSRHSISNESEYLAEELLVSKEQN